MSIGEAIQKGAIMLVIVFIVLFILYVGIVVFGKIINSLAGKKTTTPEHGLETPPVAAIDTLPVTTPPQPQGDETYVGTLRLKDVDEQTAAMIMAIVSDESGIPLNELEFKSISLVADSKIEEGKA